MYRRRKDGGSRARFGAIILGSGILSSRGARLATGGFLGFAGGFSGFGEAVRSYPQGALFLQSLVCDGLLLLAMENRIVLPAILPFREAGVWLSPVVAAGSF